MIIAKNNTISILLMALLVFSCGKRSDTSKDNNSFQLSLQVKDTVQVDYVGMLNLQDVDTEQERLLLYDWQRKIFLITDFKGSILHQFSKSEDEKGTFNFLLGPAQLQGDDQIMVIAMNGIIQYDFQGNLISHLPYANEEPPGFSGRAMFAEEFIHYEGRYLGKGVVARGSHGKNDASYYHEFLLLSWFDPESGRYERILQLQPESMFKNGKAYEVTEMMPSYTFFNEKIYLIVGTDPYLEIYEAKEPYQLISRIKLSYDPYYPSEGQDMKVADPKMIRVVESSGFTTNLKATPEYLITGYSPGFDAADRLNYNDPAIPYQDFKKSIEGKYPEYIHIMDHQGKMLSNEKNYLNIDLREFTVRDGEIWALKKVSQDIEEDFVRIYRVAIE